MNTELATKYSNKELLEAFLNAYDYAEFWSNHGNYGDGKYEQAKAERKALKKAVLARMEGN